MKKQFFRVAVLSTMLLCGASANAQVDLSSIISKVTGSSSSSSNSSSSSSTSSIISTITSIFSSSKQATKDNIVGTWVYEEPAIVLSSDNVLTNTAAKVAAEKIEEKLQTYLTKVGIKKGALTVTFSSDGTFKETLAGKTISGKWSISDSKLKITVLTKSIYITTQVSGSTLKIVTDASKLLKLLQTLGSNSTNSSIQTVTTLMNSVNGMQVGLSLTKQ